jgi:hypothetical protein
VSRQSTVRRHHCLAVARPAGRSVRVGLLASIGGLALIAGTLAGCSSSGGTASTASTASRSSTASTAAGEGAAVLGPAIPLASSAVVSTTTWATLAMGHLDDPLNTFWQLLALTGGSSWQLATPLGTATNGGLVATAGSASLLAGIEPSLDLTFSPLASSTDQGSTWSEGLLPGALAPVPDALSPGDGAQSIALLRAGGGTVVSTAGDLSAWKPVATVRSLRGDPALTGCHLGSLTAVAFDASGAAVVGVSCARGGQAGLFVASGAGWVSAGPGIPGVAGGPTEVIRMVRTASGTSALVSAGTGPATRLFALWSGNGLRSWTVSTGLALGRGTLISTGVTGSGGFVIAVDGTSGMPAASAVSPSTGRWVGLAPLPPDTESVTATPGGGFDALAPNQSTLVVYGLSDSGWGRVQTLPVDIQYGSSGSRP